MRRFRLSRFELVIAAALALAAAVPLLAALFLASRLTEQNLALGLNPRLVDRLGSAPALYRDLFQARKQLYGEQARTVATGLPEGGAALERHLELAVQRTPRLRRAAVLDPSGAVDVEVESKQPNPEGEWRAAQARVALPDGRTLECTFAIEARFFAELDDARELAELYQGAAQLRPQIQRNYVRAFGLILLGWALLAGAIGALMARRTTRRVGRLVDATRALARGNLAVQVDASGSDELATLARAFNAMVREVRESRDRIVYLEKISGWQDVARRLAHEIKNPLTPIQLAFQQLEARLRARADRDAELDRLLRDTGEIVREEIGTLQRLVEEFSGFAKLPDVRPEPAELAEVVEEFLRTSPQLAEEADIQVTRGEPCPVALDRLLMRRVLTNLVRNAIEAARPQRARVHVEIARDGDRGVLTLADEGPGIPPEVRDRMFDPYFTTRREGTGLGLAIVKKIVLQHGGEISAGARPGGGASFAISLPIANEQR
jgi:nitrogen fixation/metabolism regulation signal transduction histidine kinase